MSNEPQDFDDMVFHNMVGWRDRAATLEIERDEIFNRLGRITSELGLSMDVTASRIIEAIRDLVEEEREACASVTVRIKVPEDAQEWTPLEAFEEGIGLSIEAFRHAIRDRAALAGEGEP